MNVIAYRCVGCGRVKNTPVQRLQLWARQTLTAPCECNKVPALMHHELADMRFMGA